MNQGIACAILIGCASSQSTPTSAPAPAPTASQAPSQNEQLYAKGAELEKEGRWEEAANVYQKYVLAMGDALSYMDRSSMELRIKQLRERAASEGAAPR